MTLPPYPCLGVKPDGFCPNTPTYSARECTSGASWWASQYTGKPFPTGWGDAMDFPGHARAAGFVVDGNCTPNSIMCLPPNHNGAGPKGHVAYVIGPVVQSHAEVWEMNFLIPYGFDFRPALTTGCQYIHLIGKPLPPDPPTGVKQVLPMYQRISGTTYLVCGGTLVELGSGADITYYLGLGSKIILEADLTVAARSHMNLLPVL